MTIDFCSWGFRRNMASGDVIGIEQLLSTMVETVSCGGNILMNVGPTGDGRIVPIFEERLRQLGSWMDVNGEAIYSSVSWTHQNDTITSNVWCTSKYATDGLNIYAILLFWPTTGTLELGSSVATDQTTVSMLGYERAITWEKLPGGIGIKITMPLILDSLMPCRWARTFKLNNLKP